ncbi:Methylthioribose-1-phosphate isomerase [Pirellulimonas nuda]|uniref:Methylthioribose-1-phosphate isomerase n=1 Tax=Pirellulimonas nuda TaxID=2528009 RepID=A0A518D7S5_9BACT|nr:S-methyl-5-thioribose-1-phosphate isomerase [Pirellulimonas nuda]QDU87530.1 Methylthioribose-1-phosphate isomerase [Pirellulimonas nuda]
MHEAIRWEGADDGALLLLDQTRLPGEEVWLRCTTVEDVWQAIKRLSVRGAPAIGVSAAYGVCLAARDGADAALAACDYLATSRPTAVNLFWALERMRLAILASRPGSQPLDSHLLCEAQAIHTEDAAQCAAIGRHGAEAIAPLLQGRSILTHCNTGALATGGDGTALAVMFALAAAGSDPHVFVDETRPLLQGARLTAWELMQRGVRCTLICDSMAAQVMREGRVGAVIVGADRIAANGDSANKIGTYALAIVANWHKVPFYVAAPATTFDMTLDSGDAIPIEERGAEEITEPFGKRTAPEGVPVYNPAFDVTPAELIAGIITERGVMAPGEVRERLGT